VLRPLLGLARIPLGPLPLAPPSSAAILRVVHRPFTLLRRGPDMFSLRLCIIGYGSSPSAIRTLGGHVPQSVERETSQFLRGVRFVRDCSSTIGRASPSHARYRNMFADYRRLLTGSASPFYGFLGLNGTQAPTTLCVTFGTRRRLATTQHSLPCLPLRPTRPVSAHRQDHALFLASQHPWSSKERWIASFASRPMTERQGASAPASRPALPCCQDRISASCLWRGIFEVTLGIGPIFLARIRDRAVFRRPRKLPTIVFLLDVMAWIGISGAPTSPPSDIRRLSRLSPWLQQSKEPTAAWSLRCLDESRSPHGSGRRPFGWLFHASWRLGPSTVASAPACSAASSLLRACDIDGRWSPCRPSPSTHVTAPSVSRPPAPKITIWV